jgi:hypothetical protein
MYVQYGPALRTQVPMDNAGAFQLIQLCTYQVAKVAKWYICIPKIPIWLHTSWEDLCRSVELLNSLGCLETWVPTYLCRYHLGSALRTQFLELANLQVTRIYTHPTRTKTRMNVNIYRYSRPTFIHRYRYVCT